MGNSSTKPENDSTTTTNNDATTATQEEKAPAGENIGPEVVLHVYKQANATGIMGSLVYHSGVEVNGKEYSYAQTVGNGTGVHSSKTIKRPGGGWEFYQTHEIGQMLNTVSLRDIVTDFIKSDDWKGNAYNITHHNCNDFSDAFVKALCGNNYSIPSWVNQAAKVSRNFVPSSMTQQSDEQMKERTHQQLLATNAEYAADYYKNAKPQAIKETVREIYNDVLLNEFIDFNQATTKNLMCNGGNANARLNDLFNQQLNNQAVMFHFGSATGNVDDDDDSDDTDDEDEDESDEDDDDDDNESKKEKEVKKQMKIDLKLKSKKNEKLQIGRMAFAFPTAKHLCPTKVIIQKGNDIEKQLIINVSRDYKEYLDLNGNEIESLFWTKSYKMDDKNVVKRKSKKKLVILNNLETEGIKIIIQGATGVDNKTRAGIFLVELYGRV